MLEDIFHELNRAHFDEKLPLPKLTWNSRLSSTAGRFCTGSRHLIRPRPPQIEVATYLRALPDGTIHVRDTVLHEMIHYFLWFQNRPHGHTPEFHRILKAVGAKRYNTVPRERAFKHWYECPNCQKGFPTRRKLGVSACKTCCERFNQGEYADKFRLQKKVAPPREQVRVSETASAPASAPPAPEEKRMQPSEIVRRLEELKALLRPRCP